MSDAMFADVALAARIEAAEVELTRQAASALARRQTATLMADVSGAISVWSPEASPFNKVIGLGFEPFDERALAAFEADVLARGGTLQVELSSLAEPAVAHALARRGYALSGFENVLGLALTVAADGGDGARTGAIQVTRASADELETWLKVVARGAVQPDLEDGPEAHEAFSLDTVERALRDTLEPPHALMCYVARREGTPVGGASLRLDTRQRVAALTGAATLPAARRRGVQSALLAARLADARAAGAEIAVMTTRPGSKSQHNAMKHGFSLLYVRAVLVRRRLPHS